MSTDDAGSFDVLLQHVKEVRGVDFTGYKRATLQRRVRRRMNALGIETYEDYLDHLQVHSVEFSSLFDSLLINVTSFFRDPEAWTYLAEHVVPDLLQRREGQPIRVWSAGCASGEEAYSLAMVFADAMGIDDFRDRVKIYATDLDEDALATARHASYTATDLEAVPAPFRERYFEPNGGNRFAFRKELRRSVIFGRNDLVQDAPISHVDVLACRNTLMYFTAETQAQVLNRMHFALRPDGVLFLGKAEMLLSHSAYFRPVELKRRVFRKVTSDRRDRRALINVSVADSSSGRPDDLSPLVEASLMSTPSAQIVIDTAGRLALGNYRAMQLFGLNARDVGRPFQDLDVSYRPTELRAHLDDVVRTRRPVWVRDVELVRPTSDPLSLDIQIVPLSDETGVVLGTTIIFVDVTQHRQLQRELQYTNRQLESAYEELQSTNEELETTNEELQSTVEELETTNEELQSTNEELETMNEELQSMNDELQLTNEALRDRQDELDQLNHFMTSVLGSMSSGVAVVDADLRLLAWNARAEDLWGVRTDEAVGEPLTSLDIGLPVEQLREPLRSQLGGVSVQPEVLLLDAVTRRGRRARVRVAITRIHADGDQAASALLNMDVVEELGPS